ncbi:diguanylate cyclase (GGDEF) domain-containing protein [Desulfofustis glycolicus DSM 9705]|uniref:diguanylate cyclase n=2 Tax=Desulfofustis glycolicus TaxID=51195 RepID=A0A1M5X145_9BACT|nr:diguanylate cyclase (GGDEF) domain-containing protein [Desulfofustis glycolicus DSM 9705]
MVTAPAESDLRRGNYSLADIISIDDLQNLQDSFAKANRVASTIINLDGSPITSFSNYSAVCALVRQTEKGNANCARSGRILGELSLQGQQPACHFCHSIGFMDAAAPIVIDGVHLANWLIGQNCIGTVDAERVAAYAEEIGANKRQLLAAFDSMEKISEKEFRDKLDFLWLMANQISNQAYQHLRYQTMLVSLEQSKEELTVYKDKLEELVNQRTAELEKAIEKIQQISITDALTGCFNRGGINSNLPREIKRARRYNNPLSILLFDLDHFKKINDTYGHQSGDTVLQQVVATIQPLVRDGVDWLARYGGEEFLLVMPLTSRAEGRFVAERLRQAIADISLACVEEQVSITASFGITGIDSWEGIDTISHETLLQSADNYLYRAKKGGRNQVVSGPLVINSQD